MGLRNYDTGDAEGVKAVYFSFLNFLGFCRLSNTDWISTLSEKIL